MIMSNREKTDIIIACEDTYGLDIYLMIRAINTWGDGRKKYHVVGFVSDAPDPFGKTAPPCPVIGSLSDHDAPENTVYTVAIRDPAHKESAVQALRSRDARFETLIAPWAMLAREYKVGEGCIIGNYCFKSRSEFGDFVIMDAAMCETVSVGDYSTLCPFVNMTNATIGKRVFVGSHAIIMEHRTVGDGAYIHPGSLVLTNVRPGSVMRGVPAKRVKNN